MQCCLGRSGNLRGAQRKQRLDTSESQSQSGYSAGERQHDALGQKLPHDPPPAGAERGADCQLALAGRGTHQQQVRDICTRNQQNKDDAGLQHVQRRAHVADNLIAHADGVAAEAARLCERLKLRQPLEIARDDRPELRIRLLDPGARPQPRDHRAELVAASVVGHLLRREGEGHQQRDVA